MTTEQQIRSGIDQYIQEKQITQILFPGVVIDNNDPRMLGRLRVRVEGLDDEAIKKSNPNWDPEKDSWSSSDPYLFLPLLPFYTNSVPQTDEYVNVIYYDKNYKFKNQFYISNVLTDPRNLTKENYNSAKAMLGQGNLFKLPSPIKNQDGTYPDPKNNKGVYPEPGDNSLLGRGSSDVIVKKDEVLIRSGKTNRIDPSISPVGNINRSFIQLSNFQTTKIEGGKKTIINSKDISQQVKMMIIWNITNLENTQNVFNGDVGLYGIIPVSDETTTKKFEVQTISKLIEGKDYKKITGISFNSKSFDEVTNLINQFVNDVFLGSINIPDYPNTPFVSTISDQFPFIVTPSKMTYLTGGKFNIPNLSTESSELSNYIRFYNSISLNKNNFGFILVSGNNKGKPIFGVQKEIKVETIQPSDYLSTPKTYGVMGAQKLYLLSHDSIGPKGSVDLTDTLYGIPQDKFVGENNSIDNVTYSSVRGEELISLIRIMFTFIRDHVHPISTMSPTPLSAGSGISVSEIESILSNAENTILNQNIRIN